MSTDTSPATRQDLRGGVAGQVQDRLGRYRADLYAGRGRRQARSRHERTSR